MCLGWHIVIEIPLVALERIHTGNVPSCVIANGRCTRIGRAVCHQNSVVYMSSTTALKCKDIDWSLVGCSSLFAWQRAVRCPYIIRAFLKPTDIVLAMSKEHSPVPLVVPIHGPPTMLHRLAIMCWTGTFINPRALDRKCLNAIRNLNEDYPAWLRGSD